MSLSSSSAMWALQSERNSGGKLPNETNSQNVECSWVVKNIFWMKHKTSSTLKIPKSFLELYKLRHSIDSDIFKVGNLTLLVCQPETSRQTWPNIERGVIYEFLFPIFHNLSKNFLLSSLPRKAFIFLRKVFLSKLLNPITNFVHDWNLFHLFSSTPTWAVDDGLLPPDHNWKLSNLRNKIELKNW